MNYNELAQEIYAQNKAVGWWDEPDRCKLTLLQLVSTEIAEATEAERKDLMDDHLPHRKGGEVEMADAMIRLLDMAGAYGWVYSDKVVPGFVPLVSGDGFEIAAKYFFLNSLLVSLSGEMLEGSIEAVNIYYSTMLDCISGICEFQGYDLEGALREKLEYNAKRQDHKRSEREKENGKKF
jgi:hypothetical protein